MKAGVVVDDWKLPIFRDNLSEAGFAYEDAGAFTPTTTLLTVETDNLPALAEVIKKCQYICSFKEPKA